MDFGELVAAVVTDTNRPDMDSSQGGDGQIQQAVARATAYLHTVDFFIRDIKKINIQFDQPAFIQTLETTILPRYRALSYARKNDPKLATFQQNPTLLPPLYNSHLALNFVQSMAMFTKIDIDHIFDDYGYSSEKLNVMYQAGDTLFFKSDSSFSNMLFGYYAFPNVDTTNNGENFESWIARDFPYAIISVAISAIFNNTGKADVAKKYDAPDGSIATWTRNLILSNIELQGR
jgi:hypothetical protein